MSKSKSKNQRAGRVRAGRAGTRGDGTRGEVGWYARDEYPRDLATDRFGRARVVRARRIA